jgi:hypothetical protein
MTERSKKTFWEISEEMSSGGTAVHEIKTGKIAVTMTVPICIP